MFRLLMKKELIILWQGGVGGVLPFLFLLFLFFLLSFSVRDAQVLSIAAPGFVWLVVMSCTVISLEGLFAQEKEQGTLDILKFSPLPWSLFVGIKIGCLWVVSCVPVMVAVPLAGLAWSLPFEVQVGLLLSLLAGTPAVVALGAVFGALGLCCDRGRGFVPFLVMPLYIPIVIFALQVVHAVVAGEDVLPFLGWLLGMSFLSLGIVPPLCALLLKEV